MNANLTPRSCRLFLLSALLALAGGHLFAGGPIQIPTPKGRPPITTLVRGPSGGDGSSPWPVARVTLASPQPGLPAPAGWDALFTPDLAYTAWSEPDGRDDEISLVLTPRQGAPRRFQVTRNASPDRDPAFSRGPGGQVALVWHRSTRAGGSIQASRLDPLTGEPGAERTLLRLTPAVVEVSAALLEDGRFMLLRTSRRGTSLALEAGEEGSAFLPLIQVPAWDGYGCWVTPGSNGEMFVAWLQNERTVGLFTRRPGGAWTGPEYFPLP